MRLFLRGGTVYDGTGAAPYPADVLLCQGRISEIGRLAAPPGARVLDCRGLAVAPGFIDAHSHSDLQLLENRPEKLLQGVTTEVVGNCGFSVFPASPDRASLHDFANGILHGRGDWGWPGAREYLDAAARLCRTATVHSLCGHGTLYCSPSPRERLLEEALEAGAVGLSTGLMYSPGSSAPFEELERLCAIVARHGKLHATHMRDYGDHLIEAVEEQLELARRTGCRLQISHLQAVGPRNWDRQQRALDLIEQARAQGIDVAFDAYPYTRGSTVLTQLLPQSALDGGTDQLLARLQDSTARSAIASATEAFLAQSWDGIFVSSVSPSGDQSLVGQTFAAIASARGTRPIDAALDLLIEERGAVNILEINQSDENLRQTLSHPLSNVISDGFYVDGRPHPRLHGAFAFWLGEISRERAWVPLPEAIRKITSAPASRFGLKDVGLLKPGYQADVAIFDPNTIGSPATYEAPQLPPTGIHHVIRRGELITSH